MRLHLCLVLAAALAAVASAAAFECGKPNALCGASIPTGVKCPKGPGYCDPGYFCGWNYSDTDKTTKCMPVPKSCGTSAQSCCPGNAVKESTDANSTAKPYCSDGSYCFYTPTPDASGWSSPPYSSPANALLGTCRPVPKDCGTAEGKACCPSLYHTGVAPAFPAQSMYSICSGSNMFCQYIDPKNPAFNPNWPQGKCVANRPDCGKFGKSCCIWTGGVSVDSNCGPSWDQPGPRGYCAYPADKATGDLRDQKCLTCPSKEVVAASNGKFWPCPSM